MNLVCFNIQIRRDKEGRYCLNDLHKAATLSGANERTKEPGKFMASPQTVELVKELTDTQNLGLAPVNAVKGGLQQGTYVCKELVYSYAMWISAKFHLHVIRAFDALVTGAAQPKPEPAPAGLPRPINETIEAIDKIFTMLACLAAILVRTCQTS